MPYSIRIAFLLTRGESPVRVRCLSLLVNMSMSDNICSIPVVNACQLYSISDDDDELDFRCQID